MIAAGLGLCERRIQGQFTAVLKPRAPRPLQVRLDRRKLLTFLGHDPIRSAPDGVRQLAWPRPALQAASMP
jgi:hypothetical protein